MKRLLYKAWSKFLTAFGNVKVFSWPCWIVYDPDDYQVTGKKTLELLDILEPGDVILRGFRNYLDGKFIPDAEGWSHGALYVGKGKIIHAIAEGVSETNVIEFSRCDRIAVLRPAKGARKAIAAAKRFMKDGTPYDFGFERGTSALYCFELCGECYKSLRIKTKTVKKFFGLARRENVYLAESFLESPDFKLVFRWNPAYDR